MKSRLKILFLPAWYPSECNPVSGIFTEEHAKAASLYNDVVILHAYLDPEPQTQGLFTISEELDDAMRVLKVKYSHVFLRFVKSLSAGKTGRAPPVRAILRKCLKIPRAVLEDVVYYWSIIRVFGKLEKTGWKPDIIHAHVYTAGVAGVILGKLHNIPVVVTEHWSGFTKRRLLVHDRLKAFFGLGCADRILPVSDYLKDAIRARGIRGVYTVVPNAVDTRIFYPQVSQKRQNHREEKRILFVGLFDPIKGLQYLLQSLSQARQNRQDFRLDIVGDGPLNSEYKELSSQLGLAEIVCFHGLKPRSKVADFMRKCDFLVQPSLAETFGAVYIEAMACGKPIVTTLNGGASEVVPPCAGIMVPPGDIKALRAAIEYMLDNYTAYSPEEITRYAVGKFSHEKVGERLDNIYRSCQRAPKAKRAPVR